MHPFKPDHTWRLWEDQALPRPSARPTGTRIESELSRAPHALKNSRSCLKWRAGRQRQSHASSANTREARPVPAAHINKEPPRVGILRKLRAHLDAEPSQSCDRGVTAGRAGHNHTPLVTATSGHHQPAFSALRNERGNRQSTNQCVTIGGTAVFDAQKGMKTERGGFEPPVRV